jgi:hypothetical protein
MKITKGQKALREVVYAAWLAHPEWDTEAHEFHARTAGNAFLLLWDRGPTPGPAIRRAIAGYLAEFTRNAADRP